jgi:hypothetical protein
MTDTSYYSNINIFQQNYYVLVTASVTKIHQGMKKRKITTRM